MIAARQGNLRTADQQSSWLGLQQGECYGKSRHYPYAEARQGGRYSRVLHRTAAQASEDKGLFEHKKKPRYAGLFSGSKNLFAVSW
jgi:hypothetical protein